MATTEYTPPRIGSLFSGYLGLDRGVRRVIGGRTVWVSDIDPGACRILAHRAPGVPNLGDITKINWAEVDRIDVLAAGFPCQDVSLAGLRKGLTAETRSGLWTQTAIAIQELQPGMVVVENVRGLLSASAASGVEYCPWCMGDPGQSGPVLRALGAVLGDLADLGYNARWCGLRAADVGACHNRFRVFLIATPADFDSGSTVRSVQEGFRPTGSSASANVRLSRQVTLLPTPPASDANGAGYHGQGGPDLRTTARLLPTPAASESGSRRDLVNRRARGSQMEISDVVLEPDKWQQYGPAIRSHERSFEMRAPEPTQPGKNGPQLAPRFVEWMMGLPEGWVTDVPNLTRPQQIKALGNGVVPQQAAAAIKHLTEGQPK